MDYRVEFLKWLNSSVINDEIKDELLTIKNDEKEIEERFYKNLEFGTAGLRGILGAGTNRMNIYTVRQVTQGLADFIVSGGQEEMDRGVVISYDSRIKSDVFSMESARVLVANGIKVYLSDALRPVPILSFAVRHFKACAGIMITASHNPPEYNGYKVYGDDGCQISPEVAECVLNIIEKTHIFDDVLLCDFDEAIRSGKITMFGTELDDLFISEILKQQIHPEALDVVGKEFKMIYTPLHGSGNVPVRRVLQAIGVSNVFLVPEQVAPDGKFPTVKSPNPEDRNTFALSIRLAKEKDVDLIIGTDPDCDRIGVVVRDKNGEYICLNGNMVGVLLTEYILAGRKLNGNLPNNGIVIKTIVTSYMTDAICKAYNVAVLNVLTGFKFIGEKIKEFEETGSHTYLFGFEESYGYLAGTHSRDKDAVVASMLVTEMAAWYKMRNMSLYDGLCELYAKYGTYRERTISMTFSGIEGVEKIKSIMSSIRKNPPKSIAGYDIISMCDYLDGKKVDIATKVTEILSLPSSDVLIFEVAGDNWVGVRPSGTEPKIKFYFGAKGDSIDNSEALLDKMSEEIKKII